MQVKVKGMGYELGPFCFNNSESDTVYHYRNWCWLNHDVFCYSAAPVSGAFSWMGFCFVLLAADRWRWSLLIAGVMLLVCLTVLIFYLLHESVKSKFYIFFVFAYLHLELELTSTHNKLCIVQLDCLANVLRHFPQKLLSLASKTKSCLLDLWIIHGVCNAHGYISPSYNLRKQLFVLLKWYISLLCVFPLSPLVYLLLIFCIL